jgi:hypothetical protein
LISFALQSEVGNNSMFPHRLEHSSSNLEISQGEFETQWGNSSKCILQLHLHFPINQFIRNPDQSLKGSIAILNQVFEVIFFIQFQD